MFTLIYYQEVLCFAGLRCFLLLFLVVQGAGLKVKGNYFTIGALACALCHEPVEKQNGLFILADGILPVNQ